MNACRRSAGRRWACLALAALTLAGCVASPAPTAPPAAPPATATTAATPTQTVQATATVAPPTITGTPTPSPSPTPTSTPRPTQTASPTASPTESPTPTAAPTPVVSAREVLRGNPQRPWVALTFDADASAAPAAQFLDALRDAGARGTFFIQGAWAQRNPDLVRRMVEEGHEIGNHSQTHPDFRTLTREEIVAELAAAEAAIEPIAGRSTRPYFRPPYSYRNDLVRQVAAEEGYLTVVWDIDAFDWKADSTPESILQQIVDHVRNGSIIVQHVGDENSAEVLPQVIAELRSRGYEPVTLSEVLAP
ncbi:MAG: polysaccharide deacetylase family protein [Chloroflexi bacterium]|nr:polysaccharide deacetylase family protein [Chloroflexota bacterium]